jgi:phosphatidylserine decarboxylase
MINQIKLFWHYLLPKYLLTRLAGFLANCNIVWLKNYLIQDFVKKYPVNMQEALETNPLAYENFNAFFTRHLKADARPIASNRFVSPADGYISQGGRLQKDKLLQAKGIYYTVTQLLACPDEAQKYDDGDFLTIYLSPKDYHRIHMPVSGRLVKQTYVPGTLYSVQPFTTEHIPGLFSRNERLVLHFETDFGPMAVILVGATIVGCIGTTWDGDIPRQNKIHEKTLDTPIELNKGAELGYFKLGSTVIMVFPKQANIQWQRALTNGDSIQLGQVLAD